jgi:hypothetical protein
MSTLAPDNSAEFSRELSDQGIEIPSRAVASFDTDEHYVRLDILTKERARRSVSFQIDYAKRFSGSGHLKDDTSIGLLESLAELVANQKIDICHVKNSIEGQDQRSETGSLYFVGDLGANVNERDDRVKSLTTRIKSLRSDNLELKVKNVQYLTLKRIFLSMQFGGNRAASVEQIVREQVQRAGFDLITGKGTLTNVTSTVIEKLRQCAGFIQVLTRRDTDPQDTTEPDITWLIGEYAGALALGLPVLRFADEEVMDTDRWRGYIKIDQDTTLYPYRTSSDNLGSFFSSPLQEFLREFD